MDENKWLRRKPQSNLDYLGITLIAVAFYMALLNAQSFLNGVNRILGILAPFAGGVVIAYCLNPIVKAAMKYLFRGREKCRGLAILLAYIVGLAIGCAADGADYSANGWQRCHVLPEFRRLCAKFAEYAQGT